MIPLEITVAVFVFLRAFGEGLQVPPTQSGFFVCNSWEDYKSNATMDVTSNPNCQRNDYLHLDTKSSLEMKIYEWAPRRKNPNIVFNFCTRDAEMIRLCALATQMFSGVSWKAIDWSQVPVIFAQFPAGISTKSYIHYGQLIKANGTHFRQFDYGDPEENQRIYGTPTPPEYVLDNLKVPVYSLIGDRDLLVSVEGVTKFHKKLKSEATFKLEVLKNYTHMDFVTGLRMKIINKKVLRALKTIKQKLK